MKEVEEEADDDEGDPLKKEDRSDGNNNVRNSKEKVAIKETQKGISEKKIRAFEAVREGQEWR